ncbi:MAG: YopX family protein [Bacillota bacterium]
MNTAYRVWDGEQMHYWDDAGISLNIEDGNWYLYRKGKFITSNKTSCATLMWGTGLKGKSLFAGSIVKYGTFHHVGVICYDTIRAMFKIVPIQYYLADAGSGGWIGHQLRKTVPLEVVGDVYQNPELLEGAK